MIEILNSDKFKLVGLSKMNIILGKNGSGKSTLLKSIELNYHSEILGKINYVTPERGGTLTYNPNIEVNLNRDDNYERNVKRKNQWESYKSYSISQFRQLELLILREIEQNKSIREDLTLTFENTINKINNLLTNIKIIRKEIGDFDIILKKTGAKINSEEISSGESELISLAIECLKFEKSCKPNLVNLLLLDEPDVHLHPDLQTNFIKFLIDLLETNKFQIIIATHSTAVLGALMDYDDSRFGILSNGEVNVQFNQITTTHKDILPIFGAHPLSNLFNQSPVFLLEGDDDVRVFQQAIRSSNGKLKIYPIAVGGDGFMSEYESSVIEVISGVYDNAIAYSLRDRDESNGEINDLPPLIRFKLSCRAIENLILADEVLEILGMNWDDLKREIDEWVLKNPNHKKLGNMKMFMESEYNRKKFDLKEIRNVLISITGTTKPWEVAVGKSLAELIFKKKSIDYSEGKLCNFLGEKLVKFLISEPQKQ